MQLTLFKDGRISRLQLPEKTRGQYWVTSTGADGRRSNLISVEGLESDWVLKSNKHAWVLDANQHKTARVVLQPNEFYDVYIAATQERVLLRSEPGTDDRRRYRHYALPSRGRLVIGRGQGSDIQFESSFISGTHAAIEISAETLVLVDQSSINGTFLNARRVEREFLKPGDVISLFGLTIVVGRRFLALNNPDGLVHLNEALLTPLPPQPFEPAGDDEEIEEAGERGIFFRSPRFKRDVTTAEITIDPPPQLSDQDELPLIMVLGPALTMGIASLFMGVFAVINVLFNNGSMLQALPTVILAVSMMTGMVLWPILTRRYERRRRVRREAARQEKYRAYLDEMSATIAAERERQSQILHENVVTVQDCVERIQTRARGLWERMPAHNDFLRIRLGIGDAPFDATIKHAERKFTLDDDNLQDLMLAVAEEPRVLHDVPLALSLIDHPIVGMTGERLESIELLKGMIVQLVALHSYDELKLVFIYDPRETAVWDFVRWLPHVWSDDRSIRFVATKPGGLRTLSAYLEREFTSREMSHGETVAADLSPHYVIFALDKGLAGKNEFITKVLEAKDKRGFYVVALYDALHSLPKECRAVIEMTNGAGRIYDREDITGEARDFRPNITVGRSMRDLADQLANTHLDTLTGSYVLPSVLTFLELNGVGKIEHLNALTRWKESNPVLSLEAPVGVSSSGEPFKLDIHERHHGPHGLIAGMTGSGKSEFIMTYILSLALNYHPHEVAFVLIDYKGGGMANAFSDLPHVVGTITNLDGAAVNRSLVAINSELRRRQAIFNEASARTGESTIDIYRYQSMYRDGAVREPLPHLLIISDEFAELKSQQPEFMTQLVSAARIGRSLGVHLILATQKPSGVVDDQIWSNTRFRVCLKVQDRADSMEVIKRPDAAELAVTGRFYMQVGFNELFELGQSAWAGAAYHPSDRVERAYDDSVVLIDNLGRQVRKAKPEKRQRQSAAKQLDQVTRYLIKTASEERVQVRPLWLEPISGLIYLDELWRKYGSGDKARFALNPLIGEYDDPARQSQGPLRVPLSRDGNAIVYGSPGSGKTRFVTTLVFSLIQLHSPAEVNLYLLDFESETLSAFRAAPHVGDVVLAHETEKVEGLFKMLGSELARRRSLCAEFGGDLDAYRQGSGQELPAIVVIIHNYSAFAERYEDHQEAVSYLAREGTRYGISFVITAAATGTIRLRILQSFKQAFVLQLNDVTEYSAVLGNTGGLVPSRCEGRGLCRTDELYEFQTAHISRQMGNEAAALRTYCAAAAEHWVGAAARPIPVLPERVTLSHLADEIACRESWTLPIGLDVVTLEPAVYEFRRHFVTWVLSQGDEALEFLSCLAGGLAGKQCGDVVVLDPEGSLPAGPHAFRHVIGATAVNEAVASLFTEMVARQHAAVDARDAGAPAPVFPDMIYVVPALSVFIPTLSPELSAHFSDMLLKCDASLNANFIFADTGGSASTLMYEPWVKAHFSGKDGIWVGDGFAEQAYTLLKPAKTTPLMHQEIGADYGFVLRRGKAQLVKLLAPDSVEAGVAGDE